MFRYLLGALAGVAMLAMAAGTAQAGAILIVNGASGTSEPTTTSQITTNLNTLHMAVGNTTTIVDAVPISLAGFDEVWDVRFSNSLAITASEEALYLSFLQGGGGMFVMGENSGFTLRNDSVLSLIATAGGGSLAFVTPGSTQTVLTPFDGPNIISGGTVTYAAPGGVSSAGSGQFISVDGSGNGAGVAFGVGDLTNAANGALTTILDVNFMEGDRGEAQQNLTKNLINFVDEEVNNGGGDVPEPATLALLGFGLAGLGLMRRRRKAA